MISNGFVPRYCLDSFSYVTSGVFMVHSLAHPDTHEDGCTVGDQLDLMVFSLKQIKIIQKPSFVNDGDGFFGKECMKIVVFSK